ncbi:MAG: ClC family H(+)/Cl(-) exchange transporter, partial [Chthoniobacteraceae bacterium]
GTFLRDWLRRTPKQTRMIILAVVYALGAGLVAVAFQLTANLIFRVGLVRLSQESTLTFLAGSFVVTVGTSLFAGWLLSRFASDAAGSGIPQLKRAFWKDFGFVPFRIIWVKFIASALQIGGGSSLGREGPSVQLGGAVGSGLAGISGEPKQHRRRGVATGAAASLAAAFNTPLAAVTFVLEELVGDLNSPLLGGMLLAAMLGALVTHGIIGPDPAFTLAPAGEPTWRAYVLVPVVSALATLAGVIFQRGSLGLRGLCSRKTPIPRWAMPALGGLICWAIGSAVFLQTGRLAVFGLGYDDLSDALAGKLSWQIAALFLVTKLIATIACYGTGGSGGIFSPTLFFGAMTGLATAGMAHLVLPLSPDGVAMLAIVGMSATLGAVVRAPVTSILIVFEMTHEFALVPPLMLGALISQAISRRMLKHNFYDALLEQDGHDLDRFIPPRGLRAWQSQPVSVLANPRPIIASALDRDSLDQLLASHPFERFPFVKDGQLAGILLRSEAALAVRENREPTLAPAHTCAPEESLREASDSLVESGCGIVILKSESGPEILGLLTLHDLLRAQMAAAE